MSDFPKGGDIGATRTWLDRKGFDGIFMGWEADAILGKSDEFIKTKFPTTADGQDRAEILCGLLYTARQQAAPAPGIKKSQIQRLKNFCAAYTTSAKALRRISLDPTPAELTARNIGHGFTFVNRDNECQKLFDSLLSMYLLRPDFNYEDMKRMVRFPVCLGISRIGKTTFARKNFHRYSDESFCPDQKYENTDSFPVAIELANIFRQNRFFNVRVDLQLANADNIGLHILYEFFRPFLNDAHMTIDRFSDEYELPRTNFGVSQAIEVLCMVIDGRPEQCLVVNIDEANGASYDHLKCIMTAFAQALGNRQLVVFATVTGLYNDKVTKAINDSGFSADAITLSPLSVTHIKQILSVFFPDDLPSGSLDDKVWLNYLLWMIGGVPGYLAELLEVIGKHLINVFDPTGVIKPSHSISEIGAYLSTLDQPKLDQTASLWISKCSCFTKQLEKYQGSCVAARNFDRIFALCFTEISPIEDDMILFEDTTVLQCKLRCWFYHTPAKALYLPPVVLHMIHTQFKEQARGIELLRASFGRNFGSTRDNEALFVSVIAYRIYAYQILSENLPQQYRFVKLSKILGIDLNEEHQNLLVDVIQTNSKVTKVDKTVSNKSSSSSSTSHRPTSGGEVNTTTASSADSFTTFLVVDNNNNNAYDVKSAETLLPTTLFTVCVQEKQVCTDRKKSLNNNKCSSITDDKLIMDEYRKVYSTSEETNISKNSIFIFITDQLFSFNGRLPRNCYVIDRNLHDRAFGSVVANLRRHCIAPSAIDIDTSVANPQLISKHKKQHDSAVSTTLADTGSQSLLKKRPMKSSATSNVNIFTNRSKNELNHQDVGDLTHAEERMMEDDRIKQDDEEDVKEHMETDDPTQLKRWRISPPPPSQQEEYQQFNSKERRSERLAQKK